MQLDADKVEYEFEWRSEGARSRLTALPGWERDSHVTYHRLLVCGDADVTLEQVIAWTPEQCREADVWAISLHVAASDNDEVIVPPRPEFIPRK
jgi:hypothetical protein